LLTKEPFPQPVARPDAKADDWKSPSKYPLGFALAPGTVAFCRCLQTLPAVAGERFRRASRAL